MFFSKLIPKVLDGIEFRRVGWQKVKLQVLWQCKQLTLVSSRPIKHHHNIVVGIAPRHLVKKDLHALGIDVRQHEAIKATIHWTDCTVGIGVLLSNHRLDHWSKRATAPAIARVANTAKPRFVLKHEAQWAFVVPERYPFCQRVGEFFFQSSRACGSPCGCSVSGASLRQP